MLFMLLLLVIVLIIPLCSIATRIPTGCQQRIHDAVECAVEVWREEHAQCAQEGQPSHPHTQAGAETTIAAPTGFTDCGTTVVCRPRRTQCVQELQHLVHMAALHCHNTGTSITRGIITIIAIC